MTRKTKISVTSKQQDNSELEFKQYYDITMARYSYTMIEMRIFLCLLYLSNRYTELGENKDSIGEIYDGEYGQKIISIPIPVILGNEFNNRDTESHNYDHAIKAMRSFAQKPISFYVSEDQWRDMYPFILVEKKQDNNHLTAVIAPQVWKFINGLSGKYTMLDMNNLMCMKSTHTIRMHQIVEGLVKPITFKISTLKEMLKLENNYENNSNFCRKVLDPSSKELKKLNLTSFDYEKLHKQTGKRGKPAITHVTLNPIYSDKLSARTIRNLLASKGLEYMLTEECITALLHFGFRPEEIKANIPEFYNYSRLFDLPSELKIMKHDAENKDNPKGWVISEIRRQLSLFPDVTV